MSYLLAVSSLFLWLPLVVLIFVSRPPQRAVVVAFIVAWLFLPSLAWKISGLPDYTKMSATIFGVLMCVAIFDLPRLLMLRPRWFDLPVVVFCLCPFAASISVGAGAYDGASAILEQSIHWGFPYLIGRLYFAELAGLRRLALGIAVGGLIYVPLCLFEIRFSPQLSVWVYGMASWEGIRYGGYRPRVFLSTGLELGMWMTCSALVAIRLWASGTIKTLRGYPFARLTLALAVTTVLCKSTGALGLLAMGLGVLWAAPRLKASWPVWLLLAAVPLYTTSRISGAWSGRDLVVAASYLGKDRAESLEYRLLNEDLLIDHALKHPIFGGSRQSGAAVLDANGRQITVVDGYWILTFGHNGLIGLYALIAMMSLPTILLIRRHPVSTWSDPEVGPAAALAVLTTLVMLDHLSNAMLNPIYALILGGLSGLPAGSRGGPVREAEAALGEAAGAAEVGELLEAEASYRRAIELASGGEDPADGCAVLAEALEGLGALLLSAGRLEEAEEALRDAVAVREAIASDLPEADHFRDLALAHGRLGRALARLGRVAEAVAERDRALELWDGLARQLPADAGIRAGRANALNDLAWLLAGESDPALLDPPRAVRLAEAALGIAPGLDAAWNTLGVARYRAGDWAGAAEALERSVASGPPGGTAFDHFFLAMAYRRLGEQARARESLGRALEWSRRHRPGHPDLARFRDEALALLGEPRPTEVDAF